MYKRNNPQISFLLPFSGNLNPNNRWVILAHLLPWNEIEKKQISNFSSRRGAKAYSSRLAFGALIIKEILSLSDRDTVEVIAETPAMQYFLGLESFIQEYPFDPSLMVHFRKRFGVEFIDEINQIIIKKSKADSKSTEGGDKDSSEFPNSTPVKKNTKEEKAENEGKLIIDATCTPADIHYPTDLALLNKAREKSEEIIDQLHAHSPKKRKKPRTYRIYRTKENRNWCKKRGIRLSGHPPGRPPADEALLRERRALLQQDEKERNAIEGKFGLARIMAKLQSTSECVIGLSFLLMNLVKLWELFFVLFLLWKEGFLSIISKIEVAEADIWTTKMNYQLLESVPST